MRFRAEVKVTLKKGVLDPQGAAVQGALRTLGYERVGDVRVGKLVELWLEADSAEGARAEVEQVARRVLANPVLESFSISLEPAPGGPGVTQAAAAGGAAGSGVPAGTGTAAGPTGAPSPVRPGGV